MGNMHLVTGYAGHPHVMASDQGVFNAFIFGTGQYVFDRGSKLAASVISNNNVRIADGEIMMQGRYIRLAEGYVDLTIENGAQGKKRNDLIVARYTKDSVSGVEDVNLIVIKGTAVDSDPVDPEYTNGDILNDNVLLNDMPLYRLPLDGLNVGTPVSLFSVKAGTDPTAHKHNASDINSGTLPVARGGTGKTTLNSAANAFLGSISTAGDALVDDSTFITEVLDNTTPGTTFVRRKISGLWAYFKAKADLLYAKLSHNHSAAEITSGRVPLARGGTGSDFSSIPPYAIIRTTSDLTAYPYLYYTATANGAFYATSANGAAKFGTLPVAQGGTGATTAAAARSNLGAAASSHTHTKSQITDFPSSMPASDVYSWAKASKKPTYTASEVGAAASGHTHPMSNLTKTLLWSGTWSSGSITVSGLSDYQLIVVESLYDDPIAMIMPLGGSKTCGISGEATGAGAFGCTALSFEVSGNTLTWIYGWWRNIVSGNNGTAKVKAIYGLCKK